MDVDIARFIEENFELFPNEPTTLFSYQKDILACKAIFRIILKARQLGISTLIAMEALAKAILIPERTILFVSASDRQAKELLNYVYKMIYNLKRKVDIPLSEEAKETVKIKENNSRIISLPNNPNTIQGYRATDVYLDEYAIHENDKKILDAVLPSISHGGTLTIVSRPAGPRGEFYRIYKEATEGKNNFVPFKIDYTQCPSERYQQMIQEIKNTMDEISFREQYMCEFADESESYFPYGLLIPCVDADLAAPRSNMNLKFGIDFGTKVNSTVITIAEFRDDYIYVRDLIEFINMPYSSQLTFINSKIEELKPKSVNIDAFGVGIRLKEELTAKHGTLIKGIELTGDFKAKIISDVRILFEDKKIRIPDNDKLLQQLHALERVKSGTYLKYEPGNTEDYGKHDDFVWSLAMTTARKTSPQTRYFKTNDMTSASPIYSIGINDEDEDSINI
jgi:phage FluMu gp28-like protein